MQDDLSPHGLLALAGVPSGAAGSPPATLGDFIATVEEQKNFLEKQEVSEGAEASCEGFGPASRLAEVLLSTS